VWGKYWAWRNIATGWNYIYTNTKKGKYEDSDKWRGEERRPVEKMVHHHVGSAPPPIYIIHGVQWNQTWSWNFIRIIILSIFTRYQINYLVKEKKNQVI
jgi:hypothetical protein